MDTRKRLYKATSHALTLTERVKKDRGRQNVLRNDRFNANRNIDLNDSITTPTKAAPVKLSQIKDKPAKLKAYIEQKRTNKLKEQLEQRSPFIPYVPVGRWVERKEPVKKPKAFSINTPIKKALMSDGKILKKSTIKQIATTATKENIGTANKAKRTDPKSKKKILAEFNDIQKTQEAVEPIEDAKSPLNSTFEILTNNDAQENATEEIIVAEDPLFINNSIIVLDDDPLSSPKALSPELKIITVEPVQIKKSSRQKIATVDEKKAQKKTAIIAKPVVRPNREKLAEKKPLTKALSKKAEKVIKKKKPIQQEAPKSPTIVAVQSEEAQEVAKKSPSHTYKFYKSALENQIRYISIQLKAFTSNIDSFISKLPEDTQTNVHQTIQQGNLLVNEKSKSFEDILERFENQDPLDSRRITEDDVENYWTLLYEQVGKFKDDLQYAQEAKTFAMKNDRRSKRKTLSETPSRRSRRIAENSGHTPKHNSPACFGCTPISASKVNTPRSTKVRRGTLKKSLAFDMTSEK